MRYFIDPFGCVKNQVDAENMMAFLNAAGWTAATDSAEADLIIVNSCGFIESAKQESINAVLAWRGLYPEKKILLAGCLAQRYAKELAESLPEADGFFGTGDIQAIAGAALRVTGDSQNGADSQQGKNAAAGAVNPGGRPLLSLPGSAYVKISEGCDNRCAFCAIPLIRGGLRSRAVAEITDECRALLDRGARELCIIGQDTGSFGKDRLGGHPAGVTTAVSKLPDLLEALSALEGHFWVRLLYIHPDNFPLPILDIMERDCRFLPYFDIPFQHASSKILAAMNRRGTAESHLALVETIRRRLPDAVIRSTFLLGFPGEDDRDFAALLDFQKKARLDWLGCFTWSREEGTAAYSMKGRVPKKTAVERKKIIEAEQVSISAQRMDRLLGRRCDVLVEETIAGGADDETSNDNETIWLGRLYCQAPEVDGAAVITGIEAAGVKPRPGDLLPAKIIARRGFDLEVHISLK